MAAIGKAIFNLLSNDSTISSNVGTRIMPMIINAKQSGARSFPYITYDILSVEPKADKDISAGGDALIDSFRIQINIYSQEYSELETIAAAVMSTINRYSGTANTIKVQSVDYITSADEFEKDGGNNGIYGRAMDFNFRINNV
tara:strand:+ start:1647 stop:2075 length:429 start_codon:yes stop_codon:yes gene_type:complete